MTRTPRYFENRGVGISDLPRNFFRITHPINRVRIICIVTAAVITAVSASSCAILPAKIKEVRFTGLGISLRDDDSLHEMMELALRDPESTESAYALGQFVEKWRKKKGGERTGVIRPPANAGSANSIRYRVEFISDRPQTFLPSYFDTVRPSREFTVRKMPHYKREGVGEPLLGIRENTTRQPIERFYPPEAITHPITAAIYPGAIEDGEQDVRIELLCSLSHETVAAGEPAAPLAADFTVPWAALLARSGKLNRTRLSDVVLRRSPKRPPQLYLMQPYDPDKEPLIMIHGLLSTPLAWADVSNDLWADEAIRKRYQIWHFLYNTSAPALYSGRVLTTQLRELRRELDPSGTDPAMQSTTILAHSMGGILARRLITRPGDAFWKEAMKKPLDELVLSDKDRKSLKEAFFWEPETHVKTVIFVAVPHLGSDYADNFTGRLGRFLVAPPNQFRKFYERITEKNPGVFTEAYERLGTGRLDSIGALSPEMPTLPILAGLPISHEVTIHSIIGDRGKPGPIEESSDGVVPYWSSHLPDADSETIVPSDHSAMRHPEAAAKIRELLGGTGSDPGY